MNEREYLRLHKQLTERFRKDIEAIDRVWGLSNDSPPPAIGQDGASPSNGQKSRPHGEAAVMVEAALSSLKGEFSTKDVEAAINLSESEPPERSAISHTLKRMEKNGGLKVITDGKGRRPTTYVRMSTKEQKAILIELVAKLGLTTAQFRERFMDTRQLPQLKDMAFDAVQELIAEVMANNSPWPV